MSFAFHSGRSGMREQKNPRRKNAAGLCLFFLFLICFYQGPTALYGAEKLRDEDIARAVEVDLIVDKKIPAHLIDVSVEEGVVTLAGSVDNLFAKEKAVRKVETIRGVTAVVDMIKVLPVFREDREIKTDVEEALLKDPAADAYELTVSVDDGAVRLAGRVDSWAEKDLAAHVAAQVKGVKAVNTDDVVVHFADRRPDVEIKMDVINSLKLDEYVNDSLIDVRVADGIVTLKGSVGSLAERNRARQLAFVAGTRGVNLDELVVEYWLNDVTRRDTPYLQKSDEQVERSVAKTLREDPRVLSFDIDVDVVLGVATLYGVVDNLSAKRAAESDAGNTVGIWSVRNLIKVRPDLPVVPLDKEIALDIAAAVARDAILASDDISVTVSNQKAVLKGTVDYRYEKNHAEDVVARVPGVVEIQNDIVVTSGWEWKSDLAIRKDIRDEFFWSVFVDGEDIGLSVNEGVAVLTGQVSDMGELRAAVDNSFEGGAKAVKTRLDVEDLEAPVFQTYYYPFDYDLIYQ